MPLNSRALTVAFALLALIFLTACEERIPPGTVARVNGENISLHSVQALLDSRVGALGVAPRPSVEEMRQNYGRATSVLITHALIRQELAARGLDVSEAELNKVINRIKADYGEENLKQFLADTALREDEWRQLTRDTLAIETFVNKILTPSIRVSLEEVKEYYGQHEAQFHEPETWRLCLIAAEAKDDVEVFCSRLNEETASSDIAQCMSLTSADVPMPWRSELGKMKPFTCGSMIQEEGRWRSVGQLGKKAARVAPIAEVYAIIERELLEEKKLVAFNDWLLAKLASANVTIMPGLLAEPKKSARKRPLTGPGALPTDEIEEAPTTEGQAPGEISEEATK